MANDTEAPTSAATVKALAEKLNSPLTDDQRDFVSLMIQYFSVNNELMPYDVALTKYSFTHDEFIELATDPLVQAAIQEQGFNVRAFKSLDLSKPEPVGLEPDADVVEWEEQALTPLQLFCANMMLDLVDTRSQKKKLQDLGVSTTLYNNWLKDPVFSKYMRDRAELMLTENLPEANLALIDRMRTGDTKALSMFYEITGRFIPERGGNGASPGSLQIQNFQNLLVEIIEIIDEEAPPEVSFRIGERLRGIIGVHQTANQLAQVASEEPIVIPDVTPARPLTPRIKELMDKGVGADD